MHKWLRELYHVKMSVNYDDMDWLHIGVGFERTGKSTLAYITCKALDPTFSADRIAFNNDQMERLIRTCTKGQAVLYDEGQKGLYARESMSGKNKKFNKLLMKSAGLNLIIFVNTPSFSSLDWYVRMHRAMSVTRTLFTPQNKTRQIDGKTYDYVGLSRGLFEIYCGNKIGDIYKDQITQKEKFPEPDEMDWFNPVPKDDPEWIKYLQKKEIFMKADEGEEDGLS